MPKIKKIGGNLYFGTSSKSVYQLSDDTRALLDLFVAFSIAFVMLELNLLINFSDKISDIFDGASDIPATRIVINILFFWLAALMAIAFLRWRGSTKKSVELERIVSAICPDTLMVVGPNREIELCTASVEGMFGYNAEDVLGKKTDMLYSDRRADKTNDHEIYDAINKQGFHVGIAEGVCKNSTRVPLEIISGDLKGSQGAVLLLRDISERVQAEEKRKSVEAKLQQKHKLASLGVLAGGIAHDFNNFLMIIRGNVDLIAMNSEEYTEINSNLQDIGGACDSATELCQQMLAYSGKGQSVLHSEDISGIVKDTDRLLNTSVLQGIERKLDLGDNLPMPAVDASQIRQIILNLITNAADAILSSGGKIIIKTAEVSLSDIEIDEFYFNATPVSNSFIVLEVEDDGCGMDENTVQSIFEPFFTTKPAGRGLGLASVHSIISSHKGGLRVQSTKGKGSTFTILFPVQAE